MHSFSISSIRLHDVNTKPNQTKLKRSTPNQKCPLFVRQPSSDFFLAVVLPFSLWNEALAQGPFYLVGNSSMGGYLFAADAFTATQMLRRLIKILLQCRKFKNYISKNTTAVQIGASNACGFFRMAELNNLSSRYQKILANKTEIICMAKWENVCFCNLDELTLKAA